MLKVLESGGVIVNCKLCDDGDVDLKNMELQNLVI